MISNYSTLQTAVANWLKRDDLTDYIPDLIALCEAQMNRDFINMNPPPRAMEYTVSGTLTTTTTPPATLAIPTGYLGMKRFQLQIAGNYKSLKYKSPEQMAEYYSSGIPDYFTTNGDNFELGVPPSSDYAYSLTYYKQMDSLATAENGVNWAITQAPDMYLYGTLAQSAPFLKNDSRLSTWAALYENCRSGVEMANRKDRQSGSSLQMRSDVAF